MSKNLEKNHWTRDALCKLDEQLATYVPEEVQKIKELCKNCPVKGACIKFAAEIDASYVAAGTTKYERLLMTWKRVDDINENNFGSSDIYVRKLLR